MRATKILLGSALACSVLLAGCGGVSQAALGGAPQGTLTAASALQQAYQQPDDDTLGVVSQLLSAPGFNSDATQGDDGNGGDGDGDKGNDQLWEKAHFHLTPALRLGPDGDPVDPYPGDPLNGVYHPQRLIVQNPWTTMSGTVSVVRHESDGDWHIDVMPDPAYQGMINDVNIARQGGALVVEVIPNDQANVHQPVSGDHIQVWGPYVNDHIHGWNEVHPVRLLTEL